MLKDAYDQPVSTNSEAALEHYVRGVHCLLTQNHGAEEALRAAIAADDKFALAYADLAPTLQVDGRATEARTLAERAGALAAAATTREQSHVTTISEALQGRPAQALSLAQEHLREFPRDPVILAQTRAWSNASGRLDRKELCLKQYEAVAPAFGEDAWFMGSFSFANNELFHFNKARDLAERSYALDKRNCDCAHSMAHVLYETGEYSDGGSFLDGWLDGSAWQQGRSGHLNWHLTLFELEQGHWDRVSAIYDDAIRPDRHAGGPQIALADSASLLWRYRLCDEETAADINAVHDFAHDRYPKAGQAFADVHRAMAYALAGDFHAVTALAAETRELLADGKLPAGQVVPAVIEAVGAFAGGDYERVIEILEPQSREILRVGGSHAQFDVFNMTLIAAYIRSGNVEKAAPMLRERLDRRPSRIDEAWMQALKALGSAPQQSSGG